jgi:hypothetical protein
MKNLIMLFMLTLALDSFSQVPSYVPTNGLVGYWSFTGSANDLSGNGNNGTVNGATLTNDRNGNANSAYDFNASPDKILLNSNSNIQGNNARSISFWFFLPSSTPRTNTIYKGGTNGDGNDFSVLLRVNSGNTYQLLLRRYVDDVHTDSIPLALNQWVHYCIVYDGTINSNIKFFINGLEHTGRALTGSGLTFNTATTTPEFGHLIDQLGVDYYLDGKLDDIGIWNRALSNQEISNLYNSSNSNNCSVLNSVTLSANPSPPGNGSFIGVGYTAYNKASVSDTTQWHYVVVTKAANLQTKTYIDGQLIIDTLFQNLAYSYNSLYIGAAYLTSFSSFFKGYFDDFRMSNVVRTSTEIQNYYNSNAPFTADGNTIGLWHFDETNGATTFANQVSPTNGTLTNSPQFTNGKFGNAIYFNGINQHGNCNLNIPENNITFEFWFKSNSASSGTIVQAYGSYNTAIAYEVLPIPPSIPVWSTGDTSTSITVNPNTIPFLTVSNGSCSDTIFFNSQSATVYDTSYVTITDTTFVTITDTNYVTITDTSYVTITDTTFITVTDTLIINAVLTGLIPPNNTNTLKIFPNPVSDHITVDYGNYALMNGYTLKIENSLGQTVFTTLITQQQSYIDLSTWSGNGIYFVHLIDSFNNTLDIRKIVLQ